MRQVPIIGYSQLSLFPGCTGALFSEDRFYRYGLWRIWNRDLGLVNFIMLNPSTADETYNDNTIKRCIGYAESWGYGGIIVTNLFAYRATDPKDMKKYNDPVGPENNSLLLSYAKKSSLVVCAWGSHGTYKMRNDFVVDMLVKNKVNLNYLVLTKDGHPGHPLRLNRNLTPNAWEKHNVCVQ